MAAVMSSHAVWEGIVPNTWEELAEAHLTRRSNQALTHWPDVLRRTGYATIQEPDGERKGNIPSLLRDGWRFSGSPAICIPNITEDGGSTKVKQRQGTTTAMIRRRDTWTLQSMRDVAPSQFASETTRGRHLSTATVLANT
ncbi:hypothetical protein HPB52_003638 [Rhipicephalus sanguineus]|uniref:Uncharacterized protein n=1 Tax=Rhipicephalus sanguineus TaxID=34632 RepID=A0A9D4SM91_RHISA|nr:hypothetical protein HPB52_003638 [Rhipicephalus sanguineus]